MINSEILLSLLLFVLTVFLAVVGIYIVLVLIEARTLLKKINATMETADIQVQKISQSFQQFSNMAVIMQTGIKTAEAVLHHLAERKKDREKT